jgi:hypothetical protein
MPGFSFSLFFQLSLEGRFFTEPLSIKERFFRFSLSLEGRG